MPEPRNPYDFVPFEGGIGRTRYQPLERSRGLSGRVRYNLELLTPLFVNQDPRDPQHPFARLGSSAYLPATTIKGALRAVHEIVANGCARVVKAIEPPPDYRPCGEPAKLCASCRLLGMVGKSGPEEEAGVAGRVFFADIPLGRAEFRQIRFPQPRGGPKPQHRAFYYRPDGRPLGRKRYYHQADYNAVIRAYLAQPAEPVMMRSDGAAGRGGIEYRVAGRGQQVIEIQALAPQRLAGGEIRFVDLSEDELSALLYTLALEPGLAHKVGYGKPYGLGTAAIEIEAVLLEKTSATTGVPERFLSYREPLQRLPAEEVEARRGRARETWLQRGRGAEQSYAAFAALAAWPQRDFFLYPQQGWFRANSQTPLWRRQGRDDEQLYPSPIAAAAASRAAAQTVQAAPAEARSAEPGRTYRGRVVRLRGGRGIIGGGERQERLYFDPVADVVGEPPQEGDQVEYVDGEGSFQGMPHATNVRRADGGGR